MADRPILFSAPMVRAILDGRKSQTRRMVKPQPELIGGAWRWQHRRYDNGMGCDYFHTARLEGVMPAWLKAMPYQVGDRLWVRETWCTDVTLDDKSPKEIAEACFDAGWSKPWAPLQYEADGARHDVRRHDDFRPGKTRVAIHLPHWASRLTLIVEGVKIERLNEISHEDAVAEGCYRIDPCPEYPHGNAWGRAGFAALWDIINGAGSWEANPWVVAVTFRTIKANIDAPEARIAA